MAVYTSMCERGCVGEYVESVRVCVCENVYGKVCEGECMGVKECVCV